LNNTKKIDIDLSLTDRELEIVIELLTGKIAKKNIKKKTTTPDTPYPAVEEWAYKNSEIESINIPTEVTTIGKCAFACDTLKEIRVSENNPDYLSVDGVLLKKCETMIYSGKHVLIAYPPAREGNEYTVPDSIAELYGGAFTWCNDLERITIPKDVSYINESAIYGCNKLYSIDVAEDNPCYTSVDGVLYDKAMTTLLAYPSGRENKVYEIPDGVRRIGEGAIACCDHLKKLIVPETVVSIGEWVFQDTMLRVHCDKDNIARKHNGENPTKSTMRIVREFRKKYGNNNKKEIQNNEDQE